MAHYPVLTVCLRSYQRYLADDQEPNCIYSVGLVINVDGLVLCWQLTVYLRDIDSSKAGVDTLFGMD